MTKLPDPNANVSGPMSTQTRPNGAVDGDEEDLEAMFDEALRFRPNSEFLHSCYSWFQEKGWITRNQFDALCAILYEAEK